MKRTRIESSMIYDCGHSEDENNAENPDLDPQLLSVQFSSSGDVWEYHPVSLEQFNAMMGAESSGKWFLKHIRNDKSIKARKVSS